MGMTLLKLLTTGSKTVSSVGFTTTMPKTSFMLVAHKVFHFSDLQQNEHDEDFRADLGTC